MELDVLKKPRRIKRINRMLKLELVAYVIFTPFLEIVDKVS
jgi:hypothetical protein